METPDGLTLEAEVGQTDRGTLWRATRDRPGDRAVRFVDPRFCDERFRDGLHRLRQQRNPYAAEIVGVGWSGARYHVEYAVEPPWWTLGELLDAAAGWRERCALVERLCEALVRAQGDQPAPLGVGAHNVVVTEPPSTAPPRTLPCPALTLSAPSDLFGLDAPVLAAIAPETVRGIPLNSRAHDRYALGTLAAAAIGCRPSRLTVDDGERVEAQARGALLTVSDARSAIEPFLRETPQVRALFDTIGRYRHPVPAARPIGVGDLRSALAAATDLKGLAATLRASDPEAAVRVLSWVDSGDPGHALDCWWFAAQICLEQGDLGGALAYHDKAVASVPHHVEARRKRAEVLWRLLIATPEEAGPGRAADLAADLEFVVSRATGGFTELLSNVADAYGRLGRDEAEARARQQAADSDPADLGLLLAHGRCRARLGQRDAVIEVVRLATRRIRTMTAAGIFSEQGGREWQAAFDALLE